MKKRQLTTGDLVLMLIATIITGILFFLYGKPWLNSLNLFER